MGGRAARLVVIAGLVVACEANAGADTTSPPTLPTTPPTTAANTAVPTSTTMPTTTSTEIDVDDARSVSAVPIDLPQEILAGSEGLILGVTEEMTFPDGAGGVRSIVVRVQDGEATAVRGRECGNFYGPAPLDDLMGGTVLANDEGGTVRCTPGDDSHPVDHTSPPLDTAMVDDRAVVALPWLTTAEAGVDLLDLLTSDATTIYTTDGGVEYPQAAARSDTGEWVITLAETNVEFPRVRYVFVDDSGGEIDVPANPQPVLPETDTGLRSATFSPDGQLLAIVAEQGDGSTDVIIWDLRIGAEVDRFDAVEDSAQEQVRSLSMSRDRLVVNIDARDAEIHPSRFVVVDLVTAERTEIGGIHPPLGIMNASFIER